MPAWGNCLLVAIPMHKYITQMAQGELYFDKILWKSAVRNAVRLADLVSLDNVHRHPYQEQRDMDARSRRIGIEPTGLADCLARLGIQYGSEESLNFIGDVFKTAAIEELKESHRIAAERYANNPGDAPVPPDKMYDFLTNPYMDTLFLLDTENVRATLIGGNTGLAHTAFNTAGPCGSISILMDNCTSGIEPLFAFEYERKTRLSEKSFKVNHYPAYKYGIPREAYREAHEISWLERIKVQQSIQRYTDSSISSTINLPSTTSVFEIEHIYMEAWKHQLKGITIFREGCKEGVLSRPTNVVEVTTLPATGMYKRSLLDLEDCHRHRVLWKGAKVYIMVSIDADDLPVEVFVKLPRVAGVNKQGIFEQDRYNEMVANWDCITRMASSMLRYGVPLEEVLHQLEVSSCSLVDAPGVLYRVLKMYIPEDEYEEEYPEEGTAGYEECPECHCKTYKRENGCKICTSCGYSKC